MRSLNLADFLGLTAVLVAPVIGGQWSSWGHCSVTCGVGSQERYFCARPRRICHLHNSRFRDRRRKETRQCTKQNCRAISMSVPMLTGEPSLSRTVQETPSSQLISSLMSPTLSSVLSSSSASHSSYSDIHSISLPALSSETSSSSLLALALATPSLSTPASSLSSSLLSSSISSSSSPSPSSSPSLSPSLSSSSLPPPPKPSPTPSLTPSAPATSSLLTPTSSLSSSSLSSSISSPSLPSLPKPSPTPSLKPSSPNEYYSYFLNHKDVFLSDHVIKILEFKTNIECALACIGTENCRSFNFCPFDKDSQLIGRGHCEINARSHLTSPLNLSAKNGCAYGLPMNLSDEKGDVT